MDDRENIVKRLKEILNELNVDYSKVIVFGSRAREDYGKESDWDFLVVLRKPVGTKTKHSLWLKIYKRFHERFPLTSVDIILKDIESFEEEKKVVNTISNEVYQEGIEI